jgi:hypothetical protein
MSKIAFVLTSWFAFNAAFPAIMLLRHRRPYLVQRLHRWVLGEPSYSATRREYAHVLVVAAHRHR